MTDKIETAHIATFGPEMLDRVQAARTDYLGEVGGDLYRTIKADIESVWHLLESPLEQVAIFQLAGADYAYEGEPVRAKVCKAYGELSRSQFPLQLIPQVKFGKYRVDFLFDVANAGRLLAVECDGAEFHADRDRDARRDADLREEFGVRVLRLAGKTIWRDNRGAGLVADVIQAWTLK